MTFQFMCPQGHLLEGDEVHAGKTIQCPQCATTFIIPAPQAAVAEPPADTYEQEEEAFPSLGRRGGRFAHLEADLPADDAPVVNIGPSAAFNPLGDTTPRMVTVPCPNGHQLTTPYDTMGDEVLCPHCGAQFVLEYTKSIEYQTEVTLKQEQRDHELGKKWLMWSVITACFVVILIIALIIAANQ